jgi:hypothetical protein
MAKEATLRQLQASFGLQVSHDRTFFTEWSQSEMSLTDAEQALLDRVKANYESLMADPPLLENTVKMVILAPLLDLAGFYRPPFQLETETSVEIEAVDGNLADGGLVVRGRIDILVLKQRLWLLVIESKRSDFAATRGLPQALSYMLGSPHPGTPTFGLITNGNEFLFVKAIVATDAAVAQYATSRLFALINPENDLYDVLKILKKLGEQVLTFGAG